MTAEMSSANIDPEPDVVFVSTDQGRGNADLFELSFKVSSMNLLLLPYSLIMHPFCSLPANLGVSRS